jgi:cytoskeletal protein CcmA (bactofilin family)
VLLIQMIGWARRILLAAVQSIVRAVTGHSDKLRFGRNRRWEAEMADQADDLGVPMKPVRPAPTTKQPLAAGDLPRFLTGPANAGLSPTVLPVRPPSPSQPSGAPLPRTDHAARLPDNSVEAKTLIVGQGISLSGEINSCGRLVIEGRVEANLQACESMVIAETGLFNGNAAIDDADIYGRFEGELAVRKRLLIRASGQVSGTISYGQIEVEAGGKIAGTVQSVR